MSILIASQIGGAINFECQLIFRRYIFHAFDNSELVVQGVTNSTIVIHNEGTWHINHGHSMSHEEIILEHHHQVFEGVKAAVAQVLDRHRRLGESIVVMRGSNIVTLTGDEIPVAKEEFTKEAIELIADS
jgi:hypothetical protein